MQQHNGSYQNSPLEDLYPQESGGFVHRKKPPAASAVHSSTPHPAHGIQKGNSSQHPAARGVRCNVNVKCPCGKDTYKDAQELLVCHTCKMVNRNTLQHAIHMGYDLEKTSKSQRASHMCEQCRLDHADPFWKQFPEVTPGTEPRTGWILPLTWLKRQVLTHPH
jgi:hypothetical protein